MSEDLIVLDGDSQLSLQGQLRQKLVELILAGLFPLGKRLPSSRKLAERLGIARNTVVLAYDQLIGEGYLISKERSGIYVNEEILEGRVKDEPSARPDRSPAADWAGRVKFPRRTESHFAYPPNWQHYPYPFVDGLFDSSLFPVAEWRESSRLTLSLDDINAWASQSSDADDDLLIEQIRTKVLPRRGINARPDEILVTIGSQQALYILAQLLIDENSSVAVEEPGSPDTRQLLLQRGAKLLYQPVDEEGIVVDDRLNGCDTVVVTPSHQLPTAVTLSSQRRQQLLQRAYSNDLLIIEDDSDSESNYLGDPHPALKSLDKHFRVIYVSSLSRVISPSLRIGYMVAPAELIREARNLRRSMVRYPAINNQRATAYFISLGHYDSIMRKLRQVFRKRWVALQDALNYYLPNFVVTIPNQGGTAYWVQGPRGLDVKYLASEAARRGILIEPVDYYICNPHESKKLLSPGRDQYRRGENTRRHFGAV